MTMNKFMADVDDLIFDGQEQSHSERYNRKNHAERAWIFLCLFEGAKNFDHA